MKNSINKPLLSFSFLYQRLILCVLFVLYFTNVKAQAPAIQWQKTLGGASEDQTWAIQQTADGGYITAGYTNSSNSGDVASTNHGGQDFWVVKTTALGVIQWQKVLGGVGNERVEGIQQTDDGGYIVAGITTSSSSGDVASTNHGGQDAWIVKLNAVGTIQWQKVFGGPAEERVHAVEKTADGGYIVSGSTTSSNSGDVALNNGLYDAWVIKLTALGAIQWQKTYGSVSHEEASDIKQTTDGGYVFTGYTNLSQYWLVKIDALGVIQWQTIVAGGGNNKAASVQQTTDGGYIITGLSGANPYDSRVVKFDALGAIQWQKTYGGSSDEYGAVIQQTPDGGYAMLSLSTSSNSGDVGTSHGSWDYWFVKLSPLGVIQWQKLMGGGNADEGRAFRQTPDGGFIIAGNTASSNSGDVGTNHGGFDVWLVKLAPPCTFTPSVSGNTSLCAGLTSNLTGSATTGTAVWSSANPSVATISQTGLLTAIGAGTTEINYAVTEGGCTAIATKLVVITGPVAAQTTVVEAIGTTASGSINIYNLPAGASSSINNGVFTLNKTLYAGLTAGVYTIKIQLNGCESTKEVTVPTLALTFDPAKCYIIRNKATNRNLEVKDASQLDAAQIYQWTATGNAQQLWQIVKLSDGNYNFISSSSGKLMDVVDNSAAGYCAEGTIIQQFTADGTGSQRWRIEVQPDRSLKIYNVTCNKPLRVENSSLADGANVGIKNDFGTESFKWFIDEAICVPSACLTEGSILVERWDNSTSVSTPLTTPSSAPSATTTQNNTNAVWNVGDNYFARARGYIRPQTTGSYLFNVTGDDRAELYLSSTNSPNNLAIIAFTNSWTGSTEFTKYTSQTSSPITLTANQLYYFEVRQKEFSGGDFWRVSWQTPTNATWQPITSQFLSKPCSNVFPLSATQETFGFEARASEGRAKLQWITNTGFKNDYFEIERLNEKGSFEVLGRQNTEGGTDLKSYSFTDNNPLDGDNFYRINSIANAKGTPQYSEVKKVSFSKNDGISIFPNPADDYINVDLRKYEGQTVALSFYNAVGLMVKKQTIEKVSAAPQRVDMQGFGTGSYLLRVQSEGKREVTRLFNITK